MLAHLLDRFDWKVVKELEKLGFCTKSFNEPYEGWEWDYNLADPSIIEKIKDDGFAETFFVYHGWEFSEYNSKDIIAVSPNGVVFVREFWDSEDDSENDSLTLLKTWIEDIETIEQRDNLKESIPNIVCSISISNFKQLALFIVD